MAHEPRIIAFCCNWCTYAAADLAGTSRLKYSQNVRIIRVMCSGMVSPAYIMRAFEEGADGVLVAGCHHSDCHYVDGPDKCDVMTARIGKMLRILGLEKERFRRELIAASEGVIFAALIDEMVQQLERLGPTPFAKPTEQEITA